MNKDSTVPTAIAFIGFLAVAIFCFFVIKDNVNKNQIIKEQNEQSEVGKLADLKIMIDGKQYTAQSESSKAAQAFLNNLPLSIEMTDNNNTEKRGLTYFKLTTEAKRIGKVEIGDILISGDSYIVIATKTFKTSNKYTKLGHIYNLGDLPKGSVKTYITKNE